MKRFLIALIAMISVSLAGAQQKMSWDEAYSKADAMIKTLTLEEKISLMRGYSNFFFKGIPEKGIKYMYLSDATQGVNMRHNLKDPTMVKQLERSVAFPAPILLASTFNLSLAYAYGQAVGEECRAGGIEFLLGPGLNIYRQSQCGRNFEYFGEDPYLVSRMVENYVTAIQSTGTAACLKHFLANNTEFYRRRNNPVIDERALNEIYLPGFKAGIDAGVAAVMTSYNRIKGEWTGQSAYVIKGLLRKQLGFRGVVMTDWDSVYDWEKTIKSGQNVEMDGKWVFDVTTEELLGQGKITQADIDSMIRPTLATCIAFGLYDREKYMPGLLAKFSEHEKVAYEVAAEGVVLLKNNGILPLKDVKREKILLAGKYLDEIPRGQGAAAVEGYNNITLRKALEKKFGNCVKAVAKPTPEEYKNADIVIFCTGTIDAERIERPFNLPKEDEDAVMEAVENNRNVIILVTSGSGIRMTDWADKAAGIIYGWYPGQNGFGAIAGIIAGEINPSGKLPISIEKDFSDSPAYGYLPKYAQFYNEVRNEHLINLYDIEYKESVLVGYRWYETKRIEPLFPFGFGLSYTTFELSQPKVSSSCVAPGDKLKVSVVVANIGDMAGSEVVQLYIGERSPSVLRPIKELKGFHKVSLLPGDRQTIEFEVAYGSFAYWNDEVHGWKVDPGKFDIYLGTSSRDITHRLTIEVE